MKDNYSITFKDEEIIFTLKRTNRKSIAVKVYPDQHVEVSAPMFSSKRFILKTVISKASWIVKKQTEFAGRPQPLSDPEYMTGEVFKLLGEPLKLEVSEGKSKVYIEDGFIYLTTPAGSTKEKRKKLLLEWFRQEGKRVFSDRMKECIKKTAVIGIDEMPEWNNKKMKRRWGSCTADNKIYLNIELVSAPIELIDYVIIHELCHFIEHNHSPRYYTILGQICPDWKKLRKDLNQNVQIRII